MIKKQRYAIVSFTKLTALITENKCFSHLWSNRVNYPLYPKNI